ncbi:MULTISPECIES: ABC transporter ATP-binding protein [Gordonibacter]|uniref:ABC transporter ATP-binding protein n=1 Tax=Gordonibacter faecis TaxID=3047475 RepID=A0ABT7DLR2_9ACTN|nr:MULTISPECIES: ABC transporter ATP-binding protein [unclassified Gordonibacter]MDJ1650472.1 ABC transporter ATP-binding protein [Gordonibacter sp. KGMB12511]HIW77398.1 ABC transporter ATP-binding protein [Candidatus Gordonibacter avicola]
MNASYNPNDLLCIRSLSKHYDGFDLVNVDLTVPAGSVVGFVGSNGAGKTTTIKSVLGLVFPDAGSIELFGQNVGEHASAKAVKQVKQRVGVVFDTCSFPEEMTVEAVGKLMSYSYDAWNPTDFEQRLTQFGLPKNKLVKDLSRGMSMKLSLAAALAHDPDLLILDEATAGLDPLARDEALDHLRDYMRDGRRGILMSSHITSDLEKIADYIICIDEGRIVFAIEKDAITDLAGVAHCRAAEFEHIATSGFFAPGELRSIRHPYGIDVLAPDRFAFAENFPRIALDKADIDSYMGLMLKGDVQ